MAIFRQLSHRVPAVTDYLLSRMKSSNGAPSTRTKVPRQGGPYLVPIAKTVTGKPFEYTGCLATGLTIFFKPPYTKKIPVETINVVRQEITKRSPVLMGANRQPLVPDSVGETLALEHKESPQVMSYVLPLLIAEGFCTVSDHKPFVIQKL